MILLNKKKTISASIVKIIIYILMMTLTLSVISGCQRSQSEKGVTITIAAAASLELPLMEIIGLFEKDHPDATINTSFSGSRIIEEQISRGAPVDIFISASPESSLLLEEQELVDPSSITNLLKNTLILAAPDESTITIATLSDLKHSGIVTLGLGDPASVPAGLYAMEALQHYKIFDAIESLLIYTQDVKQVLTLLETNNIDAGFIYHTDYVSSRNIKMIYILPPESHSDIVYQSMKINQQRDSQHDLLVTQLLTFIESTTAQSVFSGHGFQIP